MFFFSTTFMLASLHIAGWMGTDQSFSIQRVEVSGCELMQPDEVIKAAGIRPATPIMQLDLPAVQKRVEKLPMVKNVSIARQYPSTIAIRVEEVEPVALLNRDGLHPVDEHGVVLPMPRHFKVLDLPVLSGAATRGGQNASRLSQNALAAVDYLRALRAYDSALFHDISEARLEAGGLVLFLMEEGVPVLMGKGQWLEKSERLAIVMRHLKTQSGALEVAEFDLRISGQVIARNKT
jgi:cell division protein FtsQ